MSVTCNVKVLEEVAYDEGAINNCVICLQWCRYIFSNGTSENGYRFIWKKSDGKLQAARGQARIPSLLIAEKLMAKARVEGWGDYVVGENGEY